MPVHFADLTQAPPGEDATRGPNPGGDSPGTEPTFTSKWSEFLWSVNMLLILVYQESINSGHLFLIPLDNPPSIQAAPTASRGGTAHLCILT